MCKNLPNSPNGVPCYPDSTWRGIRHHGKAARALLGWSQEDLAALAGVSVPTVKRLEAADGLLGGREDTGIKLQRALERAGIEFTNGKQPGLHLRKRGRKT